MAPWLPTSNEMFGMFIMTLISAALGLAGQYYRRNRATTRKLKEQARALSLAHLIFRDLEGTITEWSEGAERMFARPGRQLCGAWRTQSPMRRCSACRPSVSAAGPG